MCTHHVEQMFVFTNAFRQDYCTIPFPFVTPYYSDWYRDQCFNCFLISPDGKIVPADYAALSHDVWTRRCMQIDRDFRRRQQDLLRRPPPIVGAAITSRSTLTCCLLSNSRCQQDVAGGLSTWWWCVRGEKKIFLFFDGRASSSLTGNTSKRNTYYIHTYSLLYSITCLPYLVVTALQSNFIVRISDSKKTHNNCQHKAPRATLQQGPATQNSTQSTAETHQFIMWSTVEPIPLQSSQLCKVRNEREREQSCPLA